MYRYTRRVGLDGDFIVYYQDEDVSKVRMAYKNDSVSDEVYSSLPFEYFVLSIEHLVNGRWVLISRKIQNNIVNE